jgi:hypothetical protein
MTKYLDENSIAFKVPFILDNASAHSLDYASMCPNINVVFFTSYNLSYATSGPKYHQCFECLLLKLPCHKSIAKTNTENENDVQSFWGDLRVSDCVKLIGEAWNDSSTRLMNGCWKNLYQKSVQRAF